MVDHMLVRGAKVHNLKNIDLEIPRHCRGISYCMHLLIFFFNLDFFY